MRRRVEVSAIGNYPRTVPAARQSTNPHSPSMSKCLTKGGPRAAVAWCALAALWLSSSFTALASELRGTPDFAEAAAAANRYIEQFGAEHVLLALDIDNTVMSMDSDLGSDHWF